MPIGAERYAPSRIPEDHYRALLAAASRLIDTCFEALASDERAADKSGIASAVHLPASNRARYTAAFLRRYLACVMTVAWKLRAPGQHLLACVAEELALRAIVEVAYSIPEPDGELPERDFGWFMVHAFDDREFERLFDARLADVADPEPSLPTHLRFDNWFTPFRRAEPVHPYVETA